MHAGEVAVLGESSSANQAAPRYLVLDWQPEAFRDDQVSPSPSPSPNPNPHPNPNPNPHPNPNPNPNPNQAAAALCGVAYCSRELLEADGASRSGVACGRGGAAKISLHTCIDLFSQQAPATCYLLLATCYLLLAYLPLTAYLLGTAPTASRSNHSPAAP